jgi:hypothetical protein
VATVDKRTLHEKFLSLVEITEDIEKDLKELSGPWSDMFRCMLPDGLAHNAGALRRCLIECRRRVAADLYEEFQIAARTAARNLDAKHAAQIARGEEEGEI